MRRIIWAAIICLGELTPGIGASADENHIVNVGCQLIDNPWKVAIISGAFAAATSHSIKWRQFDLDTQVINALALG